MIAAWGAIPRPFSRTVGLFVRYWLRDAALRRLLRRLDNGDNAAGRFGSDGEPLAFEEVGGDVVVVGLPVGFLVRDLGAAGETGHVAEELQASAFVQDAAPGAEDAPTGLGRAGD